MSSAQSGAVDVRREQDAAPAPHNAYARRMALVAVSGTTLHYDKPYSYVLPDGMAVARGCRVLVPFGAGNRPRQGFVLEVTEREEDDRQEAAAESGAAQAGTASAEKVIGETAGQFAEESGAAPPIGEPDALGKNVGGGAAARSAPLKTVTAVLDSAPLLDEERMGLAQFLKERTFCPYFDAARAMLPTGFFYSLRPAYAVTDKEGADALLPEARQVLRTAGDGLTKEELWQALDLPQDATLPDELVAQGFLKRTDVSARRVGDATRRMARLTDPDMLLTDDADAPVVGKTAGKRASGSPGQQAVLRLLAEVGAAEVSEICAFAGVSPAVIRTLVKKNLVTLFEAEAFRTPSVMHAAAGIADIASAADIPAGEVDTVSDAADATDLTAVPALNSEQQQAYNALLSLYESRRPTCALLYGVTGSGKTQVYMDLIRCALDDGRQAIVLVPEIALTPQMVALFTRRFGSLVAVLHSGLSIGERVDEFKRLQSGRARIAVGTRSAVFAPLDNIGLIVMDEEQESSYKADNAPRYHARDAARFRCAHHNALLVLCSATPSMESYHAAVTGKYTLVSLQNRFGDAPLPAVEIVDMRSENAGDGIVSDTLRGEIEACLAAEHQAILLLNRRGYQTHVSCRACGHVFTCPQCSIALTYHQFYNRLQCHYCGHTEPLPPVCPACGSDNIRYRGLGTQRIEESVAALFPGARVLRMDADTTVSRYAYEQKFAAFACGDYDVMVGTQMVAKGLDFPRVGLVGVLSADGALYAPDFHAYEHTFSLITQVVGR
ncbi:MAG: primosomal protein N', partial [Oscillospiraceae bacterium]|nr:primosomal protein N' [Oscillospiraceae bacterium]